MQDAWDNIIYVGKAKNLKRRVLSYFQQSKAHPQKIKKMISNIKNFDYILTDTEFEAFMLECRLIREMKPLFNKMMKSPESYTYIIIQENKAVRTIELSSASKEDGRLNFGPYQSKRRVERAIVGLKESFNILCTNLGSKNTPCLNYSLGLCIGMCLGGTALVEYNKIIDKIIALLEGRDLAILEDMKQRMAVAAENFDFEAAAKYRDQIDLINFLINKEKVIEFTEENKNIVVIEYLDEETYKLFLIKRSKILYHQKFSSESTTIEQLRMLILNYFNNTRISSNNKLSREEIDEAQIIYHYLKSSHCQYKLIPEKWLRQRTSANIDKALNKLLTRKNNLNII